MALTAGGGHGEVVHVTIRTPGGGETVFPVHRTVTVDTVRAMVKWCTLNNDWSHAAIPREIKQPASRGVGRPLGVRGAVRRPDTADDEMWTLNEQDGAGGPVGHPGDDDPDAPDDLEASHERAKRNGGVGAGGVITNAEAGRIEILHGPVMLQDGHLLAEYGIEDGSFLHPLFSLRGGGGAESRAWGVTMSHLPWTDKEWYRAGTSSALASVSSWLNGASETMMQYNIAALAAVSSHDPVTSPVAIPDEQVAGVFGSQDQGAAL